MLASQALGSVLGYLIILVIGRYVDPAAYGAFIFALSALGIVALLYNAGFSEAHVHFVARGVEAARALGVYVRIRLGLLGVFLVLGIAGGALWFRVLDNSITDATTLPILAAVMALQVFTVVRQMTADTWLGREQVNRTEILKTLDSALILGFLVAIGLAIAGSQGRWTPTGPLAPWLAQHLATAQWGVAETGLALALAYLGAKAISLAPAAWWWARDGLRLGAWDPALARSYTRYALPVAVTGALAALLGYTDVVMLGYLKTSFEVGQYGMAGKLASLCLVIGTAVATPLLPRFSALLHSGGGVEARATLHRAERYLLLVAVPAGAGMAALAPAILHVAVGDRYLAAAAPLRVLAVCYVVVAAMTPASAKVMGSGRSHSIMVASLIGVTLNVPLNLWLIPDWGLGFGALGAALATLASTLVSATYLRVVLLRQFGIPLWDPVLARMALAGTGAAGFWYVAWRQLGAGTFDRFWELGLWGIAGFAVFALLAALLGMLRREELRTLAHVSSLRGLWGELRGRH